MVKFILNLHYTTGRMPLSKISRWFAMVCGLGAIAVSQQQYFTYLVITLPNEKLFNYNIGHPLSKSLHSTCFGEKQQVSCFTDCAKLHIFIIIFI